MATDPHEGQSWVGGDHSPPGKSNPIKVAISAHGSRTKSPVGDLKVPAAYTLATSLWARSAESPRDVEMCGGADVDSPATTLWKWITEPQQLDAVEMSGGAAPEVETTPLLESLESSASGDQGDQDQVVQDDSSMPAATESVILLVDPLEEQIASEIDNVRGSHELPSIWRVHPSIREAEREAYEPKLVSIGPLHHRSEKLLPMEELKFRYVSDLLRRDPANKLGKYIRAMRDCERRARMQYAEEVEPKRDEFVRMLVVDGCFIIEYFLKWASEQMREKAQMSGVGWGFSYLRRDLMLLENQIPFFVLVELFRNSTIAPPAGTSREYPLTLMEIALGFLNVKLPREAHPRPDEVLHLLHLHHLCLNPSRIRDQPPPCSCGQLVLYPFRKANGLISLVFFSVLDLLCSGRKPRCFCPNDKPEAPRMIPSATELHAAGVKFQKVGRIDGVNSYLKVSFREGTLEIPFLCVEESTSSKLRNFIAFEQCCPEVGSHFTSYGVFMDNLINTENDVAILRRHEIIACNKLGSDEEVAKMFNKLCKGTHLNYNNHYNCSLFKKVKEYCDFTHHRWRAILERRYFSNPWNIISLLAGIVLLTLTAAQTYFTVFHH